MPWEANARHGFSRALAGAGASVLAASAVTFANMVTEGDPGSRAARVIRCASDWAPAPWKMTSVEMGRIVERQSMPTTSQA